VLETAADEPTEPDDGNSDVSFDDDDVDFEELSDEVLVHSNLQD